MSDPTPGGAGMPDPGLPTPETPDPTGPEPIVPEPVAAPETPIAPPAAADPSPLGGDETVRTPAAEPEVAWGAPEPPRAMPWEAPVAAGAGAAIPPPLPPAGTPPPAGTWGDPGTTQAPPAGTGVLSAATVGWVAPPPKPEPTGTPGWVIASTGARVFAYILDGLLAGIALAILIGIVVAIAPGLRDGGIEVRVAYAIAATGFYFIYFVGFWTSAGKATPGMRLLKLQVANAVDGKRLEIGPAVIRWLAIGFIFSIIGFIPAAAGWATGLNVLWAIVLLITTATGSMHQGLHDRWAHSVVVRPADAGSGGSGLAVACLLIVGIILLFSLFGIVGLIFLGGQISTILSSAGSSI